MQSSPRDQLIRMITGCWLTKMLYVAAKLEIADRLADRPRIVSELALETGTHEPSLYRLLRGLASLGVFAEVEPGRFQITDTAEYLRKDHSHSVHASALMTGGTLYKAWGELLHSVQTGEAGFEKVFGEPIFDHLGKHLEEAAIFDRAMVAIHGRETAAIIAAYDFSRFRMIIDVGGGNGSQLCEILTANPQANGVVFDLPHVAERAEKYIAEQRLKPRCRTAGGSFFESVPAGGDAYLLRHIIHDWTDEQAQTILQTIRRAIPPHGRLLVIETVIPPGNDPSFAKLLDLTMLVIPGGKERTEPEYHDLFAAGGFQLTRIVPTTADVHVIEATPK
jgi:hypothetical protein